MFYKLNNTLRMNFAHTHRCGCFRHRWFLSRFTLALVDGKVAFSFLVLFKSQRKMNGVKNTHACVYARIRRMGVCVSVTVDFNKLITFLRNELKHVHAACCPLECLVSSLTNGSSQLMPILTYAIANSGWGIRFSYARTEKHDAAHIGTNNKWQTRILLPDDTPIRRRC